MKDLDKGGKWFESNFDVFILWNSFSIALHFPKYLLPALYFLLCLSFSVRFFYLLVSYLFPSSCLFVYSILGDFSLLTVVYVTGFSFSCLLVCVWSVSSLSAIWVESLSVFIHGYVVWFSSSCVGRSSISACWGLGCRVSFSVFRFGSKSESVCAVFYKSLCECYLFPWSPIFFSVVCVWSSFRR